MKMETKDMSEVQVVFPEPTEVFIEKDGHRKFKAIELSEIKGIYIKVIAPYVEGEMGTPHYKEYKEGDELFITGKDMMINFPRKEHAIVKYDGSEIHYAVAIPKGTARYVMNRLTGEVTLRKGPDMFLPDPRVEVIVRRILDAKQVDLWFPGNSKAKEVNEELQKQAGQEVQALPASAATTKGKHRVVQADDEETSPIYSGDSFDRKNKYTPPRTITLDTKYEGAVSIDVWTGYAIMVVGKFKERKVIVGPATYLLEFDEYLEVFSLSTGNPKSDSRLIKDVYLRILNNQVSDTIDVETKDFVNIQLKLSYRLNFVGDSSNWFNVENYVKFLTDRFRSIYRSVVKTYTVEEFYKNAYQIIKNIVLGEDLSSGYLFKENNMHVYDVEILNVTIMDAAVAKLMIESQQTVIQQTTTITREKAKLEITKFLETIKQESALSQYSTKKMLYDLEKEDVEKKLHLEVTKIEAESKTKELKLETEKKEEILQTEINTIRLQKEKSISDQKWEVESRELELRIKQLESEVKAMVQRAEAISPDLIAALQAFGDKQLLERMAESMAPLAILGGESVSDVFARLMKGTKLEGVFLNVGSDLIPKFPIEKKEKKSE
jgi:major vault protein